MDVDGTTDNGLPDSPWKNMFVSTSRALSSSLKSLSFGGLSADQPTQNDSSFGLTTLDGLSGSIDLQPSEFVPAGDHLIGARSSIQSPEGMGELPALGQGLRPSFDRVGPDWNATGIGRTGLFESKSLVQPQTPGTSGGFDLKTLQPLMN